MSKAIKSWLNTLNDATNKYQSNCLGNISLANLLDFKKGIACIDNLIAVEQEMIFLDTLVSDGIITLVDRDDMIKNMDKPNANGYDIYDSNVKIVAELKGTIPCKSNGNIFGSKQKEEIGKDLDGLIDQAKKKKSQGPIFDFTRYIVFWDGVQNAFKDLVLHPHPKHKNGIKNFTLNTQSRGTVDFQGGQINVLFLNPSTPITQVHINTNFKF
ncbi:MAG: hypothetical protein IJW29_08335 [Clostridia bacterium]|nr:hypothetical protein [Clostridia bacterium]